MQTLGGKVSSAEARPKRWQGKVQESRTVTHAPTGSTPGSARAGTRTPARMHTHTHAHGSGRVCLFCFCRWVGAWMTHSKGTFPEGVAEEMALTEVIGPGRWSPWTLQRCRPGPPPHNQSGAREGGGKARDPLAPTPAPTAHVSRGSLPPSLLTGPVPGPPDLPLRPAQRPAPSLGPALNPEA